MATNDQRSWWDVVGANVFLADVNLQSDVEYLIRGQSPSTRWLPGLLHEGMHHWCYDSVLGLSIALLHARARQRILHAAHTQLSKNEHAKLLDDIVRARAAEAFLKPLSEGLALFMEFDARPGATDASSLVMQLAALFFVDVQAVISERGTKIAPKLDEAITRVLKDMRLSEQMVTRKTNLFTHPLNCHSGGYLAGYLLVKTMQNFALLQSSVFADSDFFVTYVRAFIYEDFGLVAALLDQSNTGETVANSFCVAVQRRWSIFVHSNLKRDATTFLEALVKGDDPEDRALALPGRPEDLSLGRHHFEALLQDVLNNPGDPSGFYTSVLKQREFFRLGLLPVEVHVDHTGWLRAVPLFRKISASSDTYIDSITWNQQNGEKVVIMQSALNGVRRRMGKGRIEMYVSTRDLDRFLIVTLDDQVVGHTFFGVCSEAVRSRVKDWLPGVVYETTEQDLTISIERELEHSTGRDIYESTIAKTEMLRNEVYIPRALMNVTAERLRHCRSIMWDKGVAGLMNDNESVIDALARFSLLTSFYTHRNELPSFQHTLGWDILRYAEDWERCEQLTGFSIYEETVDFLWSWV